MHNRSDTHFEEISKDIKLYISSSPIFDGWAESRQILLDMVAAGEHWLHALPVLSCQAVGGNEITAVPVAAAWLSLVYAANLIDDVQDGNLLRLRQIDRPENALTIAAAWIFAALRMIEEMSLTPEVKNRITNIFAQAGFESSLGQYKELNFESEDSTSTSQLQKYWVSVILKSGSIFMAGTAAGAAAGTSSETLIGAMGDYGTAVGVIKQVIDDCRDITIDAETHKKHTTLPDLLHTIIQEDRLNNPGIRKKVARHPTNHPTGVASKYSETVIPEIIADILFEWQRRAHESLQVLEHSKACTQLENILERVMAPGVSTK